MYVYRKIFVFLHECMSASVGNTMNHALPRLHDIEAISRDSCLPNHLLLSTYRVCYFLQHLLAKVRVMPPDEVVIQHHSRVNARSCHDPIEAFHQTVDLLGDGRLAWIALLVQKVLVVLELVVALVADAVKAVCQKHGLGKELRPALH
jgi:hypothetical protein